MDHELGLLTVAKSQCGAAYAVIMPFEFEDSLSAAQNIDKFYKHLETVDSAFAALLKQQLQSILPIPDLPAQKKSTRQKFNEAVVKHLDQPEAGPTK